MGLQFVSSLQAVYDSQDAEYKTAYRTVVDNYFSEEMIVGQYLRRYYLQNLDEPRILNMLHYKKFIFENFNEAIHQYPMGGSI
jgi:hypothetical protein